MTASCPECRTDFNICMHPTSSGWPPTNCYPSHTRSWLCFTWIYFGLLTSIQLACLPRHYHQFILPSVRRVYLDLSACSVLQSKLEKAEARLKVHKSHEEALAKRCESLSAALNAHKAGESKAVQNATVMKREMAACIEDQQEKIEDYAARYRQLDQERQSLQNKFTKIKHRCDQLNERWLFNSLDLIVSLLALISSFLEF